MFIHRHLQSCYLPYPVIATVIGNLISRFGMAMVLPYLTIFLVDIKHMPFYWAGITLSAYFLSQAFGAAFIINLITRIEPIKLMKVSVFFYSFTFACMGLIDISTNNTHLIGYSFIVIALLSGLFRSIVETIGLSVISHSAPQEKKNFAFGLCYTCINVGTALGPLVAVALGIINTCMSFFAAAISIILYLFLIQITMKPEDFYIQPRQHSQFSSVINLMISDKKLLYFTIAMILYWVGYSQFGMLFAYLVHSFHLPKHVFAVMYAINGISIIFLQMPLTHHIKKFNINNVIAFGIFLTVIGISGIAVSTTHAYAYYTSMFVFTLGEIFTLSMVGYYIDQLAVSENRYTYFGISNFMLIGRVIGPPIAIAASHIVGINKGLIIISIITFFGTPFILSTRKFHNEANR